MNEVLLAVCRHSTSIMDGWIPVPARIIATAAGTTLYKARKELRRLKAEGYVYTYSAILDQEEPLPYWGWGVTDKARKSEEYLQAAKEEAEICESCFDIPKEEMLKSLLDENGIEYWKGGT